MVDTVLGDPSEAYLDPTTRKGLQGGLLQATLLGLILGLLVVLAVLLDVLDPTAVSGAAPPTAAAGGVAGFLVGAAAIVRLHVREATPAYMHTLRWRLVGHLVFVAVYSGLLLVAPVPAVFAAPGYVLGRVLANAASYLTG